jgi:hypothetical protein
MLIDDQFLMQALLKNITVTFVPVKINSQYNKSKGGNYRINKHGEQHIYTYSNKRRLYGVVEVTATTRKLIKNVTDNELLNAGFTRDDFEKWCITKFKLTKDDYIGVVEFELMKLKPAGKIFIKHIITG